MSMIFLIRGITSVYPQKAEYDQQGKRKTVTEWYNKKE